MLAKIFEAPPLTPPELYVYILKTESGLIKIGQTPDVAKKIKSISKQSKNGYKVVDLYYSAPTYLKTLKKILYENFSDYRIQKTDWLEGINFAEVCDKLKSIMHSETYEVSNNILKHLYDKKEIL